MSTHCELSGTEVDGSSLRIKKAFGLWKFLSAQLNPYARLISVRRNPNGCEVIVFEVDVEIPQIRRYPIETNERLATEFYAEDDRTPETLALRSNFPLVPHINPRPTEFPRSLCIYEESYDELRLRWTSAAYVERVRAWLSDNATGKLHRADQPLEPVFIDADIPLILPADAVPGAPQNPPYIGHITRANGDPVFLCHNSPRNGQRPTMAIVLTPPPQLSVHVRVVPTNLLSLHELLETFGIDFISELSKKLKDSTKAQLEMICVIVINFPQLRELDGEIERYEPWAFATTATVGNVGEAIGLWERRDGQLGHLIGQAPNDDALRKIFVLTLKPVQLLSRNTAADFNKTIPSQKRILAIGAGTLGSRVLLNSIRAGYGIWTVVDFDYLSPHNVARHELTSAEAGLDKALALADRANKVFEGAVSAGHCINVLKPGENLAEMERLFEESEVICDMSASLAVARYLANEHPNKKRCISLFLNPSGNSIVILAEDSDRNLRLDDIEMQYYRHLTVTPQLADHLRLPGERIRYAHACRDVSSRISNETVVICAALGSRIMRQSLEQSSAVAKVAVVGNIDVEHFDIPLSRVQTMAIGPWRLRIDDETLRGIRSHRISRLPNETGGVLIGSLDLSRMLIYISAMLPSPEDSEEYPTLYIRGSAGLKKKVEEITRITAGQLQYIGEWHSHPDRHDTEPSTDDRKLFDWLTKNMAKDDMPPVMCIVGQNEERWFTERMDQFQIRGSGTKLI